MSWLLTSIEQNTSNGTITVTSEVSAETTGSNVDPGKTSTRTTTKSVGSGGTRTSVKTVDTNGEQTQKSHYAMAMRLKIPIHNKQPIAST